MRRRRFLRAALGALAATPLARFLPKDDDRLDLRLEYVPEPGKVDPRTWEAFLAAEPGEPVTLNYWLHRVGYPNYGTEVEAINVGELERLLSSDESARRLAKAVVQAVEGPIG